MKIEEIKQKYAEMFEFKNWNELREFHVLSNQHESLNEIEKDLIYSFIEELEKNKNNGWIRIDSENDLPKDDTINYFIKVIDRPQIGRIAYNLFRLRALYFNNRITHYKIDNRQEPPIY